jgi:hypothetical protein
VITRHQQPTSRTQRQTSGDGSTNLQAGRDNIVEQRDRPPGQP